MSIPLKSIEKLKIVNQCHLISIIFQNEVLIIKHITVISATYSIAQQDQTNLSHIDFPLHGNT